MPDDWEAGGFGIYVHWPFCAAKCPYCDFNSHVVSFIDHDAWANAYITELTAVAQVTGPRIVRSVFFGGGTPSLMKPETTQDILDEIAKLWPLANDVEVTLEANPTSVEADKFRAFRQAGVNRVSMGIQALNDTDLKRLGRLHSAQEAMAAFEIARTTFDRVSFDIIYGRQDQTLVAWERELRHILDLAADHLSLYQLTIEPNTAFGDRYKAGKLAGLPSDDLGADLYDTTQAICAEAGLPAYEVSNHAKPGSESRHNQIYWRYGDYAGIGPGAHGRLTLDGQRWATEQSWQPGAWLKGETRTDWTALSPEDQVQEFVLMGLRLKEGLDMDRYTRLAGSPLNPDAIDDLTDMGLVTRNGQRLAATETGFPLLNRVIATLLDR